MQPTATFDQMLAQLSCEGSLPQIPMSAMRLGSMVEQELISQDVLRVVAGDPSLTAALLRSASSPLYALSPRPVAEVRTALSILGVRGVKSVSMSQLLQGVVHGASRSTLDTMAFIQHSTFVGIMAKYVFLRRKQLQPFPTQLMGDELFAAGILHDLGVGLLAVSFPDVYDQVSMEATARAMPFAEVFQERFEHRHSELTLAAFDAWKLPKVFRDLLSGSTSPTTNEFEPIACACLVYADFVATTSGHGESPHAVAQMMDESTLNTVGLPEAELAGAIAQVHSHAESCLVSRAA